MGCFAIGRIDSSRPWTNLMAPIQKSPGYDAQKCIDEQRKISERAIVQAVEQAVDAAPSYLATGTEAASKKTCRSRISSPAAAEKAPVVPGPVSSMLCGLNVNSTSRAEFTEMAEKREIEIDLAKFPALDVSTQQYIISRYRVLHTRIKEGNLYKCHYLNYFKECCRYSTLFLLFLYTLNQQWYMTSACFLGLFWHQIMFSAHDAGHLAITSNFVVDSLIGIFIADFCCGLSLGWWKSSHNVHHLITNMPVSLLP